MTEEELKKVQAKKSFIIHKSLEVDIREMEGEEVKTLMIAIFDFVSSGQTYEFKGQSNKSIRIAFNRFVEDYKRDSEAWLKTCNKNRENIRKRWDKNK